MKSFPSLLHLLLVTLSIAVDGHDNLRGSNSYYKGSGEFRLQPRMLGKECTRSHPSPNARGRNPSNQTYRRNRRPASRTRDTVPSSFRPFKNIFASNSRRTTTFLKVETLGPETAGVDEDVDFIITVQNAEDCWMATDVVVFDDLPTEGSFLSCEPDGTIENSTLSVKLHDLVPGETAQVTLHWRAPSTEGMVINHACADALNAEETPDAEARVHVEGCPSSQLETQVNVTFTGNPDNLTSEDINALEQSFVLTYNGLADNFCDPYFRTIQATEVLSDPIDVSDGDGRFLQPGFRELHLPIKVTGRCRGNEAVCERLGLFKHTSRRRDLSTASPQARFIQEADPCECSPDDEEREPKEDDFLVEYNQTVSSLNLTNVDDIGGVEEPNKCPFSAFETQVNVTFTGDPDNLTPEEINTLEQSFVASYNDLAHKLQVCDPYSRAIQKAESFGPPIAVNGEGRLLQPLSRAFYINLKVRGICRGNEDVCASLGAFKQTSRRRDLSSLSHPHQNRRMQVANPCVCPDGVEEREPEEDEFLNEYDQTVSSETLPHVDGVNDVDEIPAEPFCVDFDCGEGYHLRENPETRVGDDRETCCFREGVCAGAPAGSPCSLGDISNSLIPNPSFEDFTSCPTSFYQLHRARDWVQATDATSDYFVGEPSCSDAWWGNSGIGEMPQNASDGNAFVGSCKIKSFTGGFSSGGYYEYIGACLNSPLLSGVEYTFTLDIAAATDLRKKGGDTNGATELLCIPDCNNFQISGYDYKGDDFEILATATPDGGLIGGGEWKSITFEVTPTKNCSAIMFGPALAQTIQAGQVGSYVLYDFLNLVEGAAGECNEAGECVPVKKCNTDDPGVQCCSNADCPEGSVCTSNQCTQRTCSLEEELAICDSASRGCNDFNISHCSVLCQDACKLTKFENSTVQCVDDNSCNRATFQDSTVTCVQDYSCISATFLRSKVSCEDHDSGTWFPGLYAPCQNSVFIDSAVNCRVNGCNNVDFYKCSCCDGSDCPSGVQKCTGTDELDLYCNSTFLGRTCKDWGHPECDSVQVETPPPTHPASTCSLKEEVAICDSASRGCNGFSISDCSVLCEDACKDTNIKDSDIYCFTSGSCVGANIEGSTVHCAKPYSCSNATFEDSTVECSVYACDRATFRQTKTVTCSGSNGCLNANFYECPSIQCRGRESCKSATFEDSTIACAPGDSCDDTTFYRSEVHCPKNTCSGAVFNASAVTCAGWYGDWPGSCDGVKFEGLCNCCDGAKCPSGVKPCPGPDDLDSFCNSTLLGSDKTCKDFGNPLCNPTRI